MRVLLAIAGLLTGLVLWTAPAMAHGAHNAVAHKPIVTAEKDVPTGPRICLFSQNGKRAQPALDDAAKVEPPHDADPAHDPTDHSHPIGEDTHHQKAAHGALDVAQQQNESDVKREVLQQPEAPQTSERVCGIDVTPPVPPPLG